jgi:hypothetical protein
MGHVHLGELPRTRQWRQVVALIAAGAGVSQVAQATMEAAQRGLAGSGSDRGLVDVLRLLIHLPLAARTGDYLENLADLGLTFEGAPTLIELNAAVAELLDKVVATNGRSDLNEMAQMAAVETIAATLGPRVQSVLVTAPEVVRHELGRLSTVAEFGKFMRGYYARFAERYLGYFLSRELTHHVGEGRRFATLAQLGEYTKGLSLHCYEAAKIVESFCGEWVSKTKWQQGGISRRQTVFFAHGAAIKLADELKQGAA